jgi:hypothetical protein
VYGKFCRSLSSRRAFLREFGGQFRKYAPSQAK